MLIDGSRIFDTAASASKCRERRQDRQASVENYIWLLFDRKRTHIQHIVLIFEKHNSFFVSTVVIDYKKPGQL